MLKVLKNEWLKVRKSGLIWISIGGASFAPIISFLIVAILRDTSGSLNYQAVSYYEFSAMILRLIAVFVSIIFYNYFAAELVSREFRYGTFKSQLTIPISRTDFLFSKVLFATIWVMLMTLFSFCLSFILSWFLKLEWAEFVLMKKLFVAYLKAGFLVLPFTYFTISLVLLFRSVFFPMVINIFLFIVTIVVRGFDLYAVFPWTAPSRILFVASSGNEIRIPMFDSYAALFWLAFFSIYFSYKRINKMEF